MTTRCVEALIRGDEAVAELRRQSVAEQREAYVARCAATRADIIRSRVGLWFFEERTRLARLGVHMDVITQCKYETLSPALAQCEGDYNAQTLGRPDRA